MQPPAVGADAGGRPEPLQMRQRRRHRYVMGGEQSGVTGEGPPHAQRLRRREGGVEPGHRPHRRPVSQHPVDERVPQRRPQNWVTAFQQRLQRVRGHLTSEAETGGLAVAPHPGLLAGRGGEVLGVVAGRRRCRGCVQRRDAQHHCTPAPAGTCLSLVGVVAVRVMVGSDGQAGSRSASWVAAWAVSRRGARRRVSAAGGAARSGRSVRSR